MAERLIRLIQECGASVECEAGTSFLGPRATLLSIQAARGLCLGLDLDGDNPQPDVFVLSWYIRPESSAQLNEATFGGSVNQIHKAKATYIARGFEDLCRQLRRGLTLAHSGEAFLPCAA